jgi:hypothetical protein
MNNIYTTNWCKFKTMELSSCFHEDMCTFDSYFKVNRKQNKNVWANCAAKLKRKAGSILFMRLDF